MPLLFDLDEDCVYSDLRWPRPVELDNLLWGHGTALRVVAADLIRKVFVRVRVDEGCFHFQRYRIVESMSMDNDARLEASLLEVPNSVVPQAVFACERALRVRKDAVAATLADVERAPGPRIFKTVDIRLQTFGYLGCERVQGPAPL